MNQATFNELRKTSELIETELKAIRSEMRGIRQLVEEALASSQAEKGEVVIEEFDSITGEYRRAFNV